MNVITANPTGLCFGVKRAIESMEKALGTEKKVYCIGSPIHNPQEVSRLKENGLTVVNEEDQIPRDSVVFIRAHGIAPTVYEKLRNKNARIIDGTCPFVRTVQQRGRELSEEGYHLLVVGDEHHPEIQGILGYVKGPWTVVSSSTELNNFGRIARIGVVSQTTQQERVLAETVAAIVPHAKEVRVYNTICQATAERQKAVARLAAQSDGIILIGGHDSANTGRLNRIALDAGCDVQWIECADQLDRGWLTGKQNIGIAAGASTPDWLIEQLINAIKKKS